LVELSECLANQ